MAEDNRPWFDQKRMAERHRPGPGDILVGVQLPDHPVAHGSGAVLSTKVWEYDRLTEGRVESMTVAVFHEEIRIARQCLLDLCAP